MWIKQVQKMNEWITQLTDLNALLIRKNDWWKLIINGLVKRLRTEETPPPHSETDSGSDLFRGLAWLSAPHPNPGLDFCLSKFTDNSDTAGINMEHCCNIVTLNQSTFDLRTLKDQLSKPLWFSDISLVVLLTQTTNRRFLGPQCCVHSLNSFAWSRAPRWTKETTMDPR